MKRILLTVALSLCCGAAMAQVDEDLLSPPILPDVFERHLAPAQQEIQSGMVVLTGQEIDALILGRSTQTLNFPSIDSFTGNSETPLEFRRIRLFAESSRIWVAGESLEPFHYPRERHFYIASNQDTGLGLAVDPVSGMVTGFASKNGAKFTITGDFISQLEFIAIDDSEPGSNSCSTEMKDQPIDVQEQFSNPSFTSDSAAASGDVISYQAVVAIDTDNEWLNGFGNDEVEALDWITDTFLAMNVFFERDIETRLLIGDVILRVDSPDPYTVPSDRFGQLDEFGEYWKNNYGFVDREFAAMFSGRSISGGSFSGIAWIDQYCDYGHPNGGTTAGSFSYNAIGSSRSPGNTAMFIGHELGHNLGSRHTHCYNPPVDQCYNGEGGCYSGAPQCPQSGRGTIMSYCHVGGSNGAGCGSDPEFHPTVQGLLESRLSNEMAAGCIAPFVEPNPQPEYSSIPAANSLLNFGNQETGTESSSSSIQVTNLGDANLLISSCDLSGTHSASFNINACPSSISPSGSAGILISCEPQTTGPLAAQLTVSTNDSNEGNVEYNLSCNGVMPPEPEFESSPAANSTINFGNQVVQTLSQNLPIEVSNPGGEALLLTACNLSGSGSTSFSIDACPASIAPSSEASILINCEPQSMGPKTATLTVLSNDSDESNVSFGLSCSGVLSPEDDDIFVAGFEDTP